MIDWYSRKEKLIFCFRYREYTLSVGVLELSVSNLANWHRKSACICVLFVSFVGSVVESVVVSVGRVSVVVVIVDDDDDGLVVEVDAAETSKVLCDTGSTIANGFLARFSIGAVGADGAYGFVGCIFGGTEDWGVGIFAGSI